MKEGVPLVLVSDDPSAREEMVRQFIRIGYDSLDGFLEGGMESWRRSGLPVASLATATPEGMYPRLESGDGPLPLDVRFGYEWQSGHLPGAAHVPLGDLPEGVPSLDRGRSYVPVCAADVRASTEASVLERAGFDDVAVLLGGTDAWTEAGYPLETPPAR